MTSIVNTASGSNNPFERLRPSPRSEEDDIRKGIFGQALRLLHTASDEDKLRWRRAIEEATAPKQPSSNSKKNKKKEKEKEEKSNDPLPEMEATTLAVKRPREGEVEGEAAAAAAETEKKENNESKDENENEKKENEKENEKSDVSTSSNSCSEPTTSKSDVRQPSDLEFIAAYLRTLLEKVVGLSLQELNVDALRVLCVMLGIPLPASKSKMIHYSILASFYYTHCEKLGKRVSSSHHLEAQLKRDEEMVRKIYANKLPSITSTTTTTTTTTTTSGKTTSTKKSTRNSSGKNDMLRVVDGNVSSTVETPRSQQQKSLATQPPQTQAKNTTGKKRDTLAGTKGIEQQHPVEMQEEEEEEEGEEELEIHHNNAVFTQQTSRQTDKSNNYYNNNNNNNNMDGEWSMVQLEQKVASIVHLYDPVTTAVVVKKLAQMGYRNADAAERVEDILNSFHQRQFVFYDNGIAYLL
ncbi:uncharacterized protein TM35_000083400 [Trypanosoma theileri]|uniref:Uncharacterized protein n=1 Tax=Trypanosoma theileri TaxID=67003 RepID=A0A1X0P0V6_9TRYP|nr:uncharacterized protein TM35_000083400 [Trypanosoma theileri]ORC90542.1 hypothetical protein TM35_000083400 [Trypanosoma theileri]